MFVWNTLGLKVEEEHPIARMSVSTVQCNGFSPVATHYLKTLLHSAFHALCIEEFWYIGLIARVENLRQ